ncbi:MAG TPA: signal peptidase II [Longimicrobiaceae bacterium]|nr:signal peptidase II [Longimicrobiaceae bacterium]
MNLAHNRRLAAAILGVVAADWLTKFWIQNRLVLGTERTVVDGWLWLAHHHNPGISFSAFAGMPDAWRTPLLAVAALLGLGVAGRILLTAHDAGVRVAAALVMAGALGNLGDRLVDGGVTDFIRVRFFPFIFNLADVAITAGAVLLLARLLLEEQRRAADSATPTPG